VYINFTPLTWEKGPVQLDTAVKMGTTPDIAPVGNDSGIIGKGILEPLNAYLTADEISDFRSSALNSVTYKEEILAMPWMITTYTMVLNLDLFKEREVEPPVDGNWTYDEFIDKLKQLTYSSKENGKIDFFGFHSFIEQGYYNTWGILLSDGAQILDNDLNYGFNDEKALRGLKRLIDLKQKYRVTPPDFGENTSNEAWTNFYKDKNIAVYPVGTWALNVLEQLKKEGSGFEYTVANFPRGSIETPVVMSSSVGSYGIFKQEQENKKEVCIAFLKFLADSSFQMDLSRLGVFPVKKSVGNIYEEHPLMTEVYNSLENTMMIPSHPHWNEIDKILQNEIRQGILGKKSPEQLLKDAEEKVGIFLNNIKED
jgi:multiple sugar transport system substrate-binding protein